MRLKLAEPSDRQLCAISTVQMMPIYYEKPFSLLFWFCIVSRAFNIASKHIFRRYIWTAFIHAATSFFLSNNWKTIFKRKPNELAFEIDETEKNNPKNFCGLGIKFILSLDEKWREQKIVQEKKNETEQSVQLRRQCRGRKAGKIQTYRNEIV